ncbi:SAV_915 family protein [Streptomyces alanosinicus]|uniref:SAV_915 family protein n=1 Tax=Streptomyces alanosinicus TaxID=68171 RepID=UPI003570B71A
MAFTSEHALTATLGPGQAWIRLAEPALRALTAPLGVTTVTVDPRFSAPAPTRTEDVSRRPWGSSETAPRQGWWDPQAVGVLRVTGAAALISALSMWLG